MKDPKYLYSAYRLFDSIMDQYPMMTGCYQWINLFNGQAKHFSEFPTNKKDLKDELEKFDCIMVNADPVDVRLTYEMRRALGNSSSTQLVLNQDHAPELWDHSFDQYQDFRQAMSISDKVFATSPIAQGLMQGAMGDEQKVWLNPHPCETHVLKRIKTTYKSDHLLVFWHRYLGGQSIIPWMVASELYPEVSLTSYMQSADRNPRRTATLFKRIIPSMDFIAFIKLLKEATFAYEPFDSYTFGRNTCDTACSDLPTVGNSKIYSMQVNYPLTNCDPYNFKAVHSHFNSLKNSPGFADEVKDIASYNVEYFGHKACKARFMAMLEEKKPVKVEEKEIKKKAKQGEADTIGV